MEHIAQNVNEDNNTSQPFIVQNNRCFSCHRVFDTSVNQSKITSKKDQSLSTTTVNLSKGPQNKFKFTEL